MPQSLSAALQYYFSLLQNYSGFSGWFGGFSFCQATNISFVLPHSGEYITASQIQKGGTTHAGEDKFRNEGKKRWCTSDLEVRFPRESMHGHSLQIPKVLSSGEQVLVCLKLLCLRTLPSISWGVTMDDYQRETTWRQKDALSDILEKVREHRHNIA